MTIQDSWGGDIPTAAISHIAQSTPEKLRYSTTSSFERKRIGGKKKVNPFLDGFRILIGMI